MSLQISEWTYSGKDPELIGNTGAVHVKGEGVDARFDYAGWQGITREDAMRQAREFIAAADMLAALKAARGAMEGARAAVIQGNEVMAQLEYALGAARAAIAKAEGRA